MALWCAPLFLARKDELTSIAPRVRFVRRWDTACTTLGGAPARALIPAVWAWQTFSRAGKEMARPHLTQMQAHHLYITTRRNKL